MMDLGLLVSLVITVTIVSVFVRPWPRHAVVSGAVDTAIGAALIGLLVGRLAAVAVDDPGSLTSLSDLMVIRSGVEFWPGLLAGVLWLARGARRDDVPAVVRLAALVPAGLVAWASYEATCLVRDGCPGPASALGLRPDGLATRVFPIGLMVAASVLISAWVLDRRHRRGESDLTIVVAAIAVAATIRSVASIWLPRISDGPTRQHRTSMAVAATAIVGLILATVRERRRSRIPTAR